MGIRGLPIGVGGAVIGEKYDEVWVRKHAAEERERRRVEKIRNKRKLAILKEFTRLLTIILNLEKKNRID